MAKTVLITGTSRGVGEVTAKLFASRGWNVAATARDPVALGAWATGPNIAGFSLDVTDRKSIADAVAGAEQRFGAVDVLVNNAGGGLGGPVEGATPAQIHRLFDQNVFGPISAMQAVLPAMRRRRSGLIINVSSLTGALGFPFLAPYSASKFALEGLSESMVFELETFGIRIKLIQAGGIKTGFTHEWSDGAGYEPESSIVNKKMGVGAAQAKGPEGVAKVIFQAATDGKDRLRYTANGAGPLLWISKHLPSKMSHSMIRNGLMGKPRRAA